MMSSWSLGVKRNECSTCLSRHLLGWKITLKMEDDPKELLQEAILLVFYFILFSKTTHPQQGAALKFA